MAFKKVDFYWSDRWQKVINVYQCPICKNEFTDLSKTKPELEKEHTCLTNTTD